MWSLQGQTHMAEDIGLNRAVYQGMSRPTARHRARDDSFAIRELLIQDVLGGLARLRVAMLDPVQTDQLAGPTASDAATTPLSQSDEEYWLSHEGLTSESRFREKLSYLVSLLSTAYFASDIDAVCDAFRRMLWVHESAEEEPLFSVYASGIVLAALSIGYACADLGLIENGYSVAERCITLLHCKQTRRAAERLPERPDSECWFRLYALLAELKWRGPQSLCDRVMTPSEVIDEFEATEQRCIDFLERTPSSDPTRNARVRESLAWGRLDVIKLAYAHCEDRVEALVGRFNKLYGNKLATEVGHFLANKPCDKDSPWYWDLELFKWCVCGPATPDEAILCYQWRLDASRVRRHQIASRETYDAPAGCKLECLLNMQPRQEVRQAS